MTITKEDLRLCLLERGVNNAFGNKVGGNKRCYLYLDEQLLNGIAVSHPNDYLDFISKCRIACAHQTHYAVQGHRFVLLCLVAEGTLIEPFIFLGEFGDGNAKADEIRIGWESMIEADWVSVKSQNRRIYPR